MDEVHVGSKPPFPSTNGDYVFCMVPIYGIYINDGLDKSKKNQGHWTLAETPPPSLWTKGSHHGRKAAYLHTLFGSQISCTFKILMTDRAKCHGVHLSI